MFEPTIERRRIDGIKTIAIDFDDVLVPCMRTFVDFCFFENLAVGSLEALQSIDFSKIFGCDYEKGQALFEAFVNSDHWTRMHATPPSESCLRKLKELKREGYRLIVVTAREHRFEEITRRYLDVYFDDIFDDVKLCNYYGKVDERNPRTTKAEMCRREGCSMLIDDNYAYVKEVELALGIRCILFGRNSWTRYWAKRIDREHGRVVTEWDDINVDEIRRIL